MKRLLLALLMISAAPLLRAAGDERCSGIVDVRRIPLIELPSSKPGDHFAVIITGDGGWRRIDQKLADRLRANGIPVTGFLSSSYFRRERSADESACALERVIRAYKLRWQRETVLLIGYSRGAGVLPFMVSRLPHEVRASVRLIALLGLEPTIDFKYNPPWTLAHYFRNERQYAVLPELEKLRGDRILCVYGEKEKDSLCPRLDPALFRIYREPGGHHFGGQYHDVASLILAEAQR